MKLGISNFEFYQVGQIVKVSNIKGLHYQVAKKYEFEFVAKLKSFEVLLLYSSLYNIFIVKIFGKTK